MTGQLVSGKEILDSDKGSDEFFVPIMDKSSISEDRLFISIEGSSLKPLLPEVRWGSKVPFYFQIVGYEPGKRQWILR